MAAGVNGLLRDKTDRPASPLAPEIAKRVIALTRSEPSGHEATHWTGRAIAEVAGISVSPVQRITASLRFAATPPVAAQAVPPPWFSLRDT